MLSNGSRSLFRVLTSLFVFMFGSMVEGSVFGVRSLNGRGLVLRFHPVPTSNVKPGTPHTNREARTWK